MLNTFEKKKQYVQQTRLKNYRASLVLEGIQVSTVLVERNLNHTYGNHADDGVSKSGIVYDYVIDNNGTKVDLTKEVYNNFIYKEDLFR